MIIRKLVTTVVCAAIFVAFVALLYNALHALSANRYTTMRPSLSPDGKQIVFGSQRTGNGDIYIMGADGSHLTRLTKTPEIEDWPIFSPNGRSIVFSGRGQGESPSHLYVMDLDGGNLKQLTHGGFFDCAPSFSADGLDIVFFRARVLRPYSTGGRTWDMYDIYRLPADGGDPAQITEEGFKRTSTVYFNGKDKLIFGATRRPVTNDRIRTVVASPGNASSVSEYIDQASSSVIYADPFVSADSILFVSDSEKKFNYEVYLANLKGGAATRLTSLHSYIQMPFFDHSNKGFYFLSDPKREGRFDLWWMSLDGSNKRLILGQM